MPTNAIRYARLLQTTWYEEQYSQQTNVYEGAFQVGGWSFGQKNRQYVVQPSIASEGRPTSHVVEPNGVEQAAGGLQVHDGQD